MAEGAGGLRGLFGGFAVEGLEPHIELRCYGRWPEATATSRHWKGARTGPAGYAIAETGRLFIGAGPAWAAAATRPIARPLSAPGAGIAAPTIIAQLAEAMLLTASPEPSGNPYSPSRIPSSPQRVHSEPDLPAIQPGTVAKVVE
jgi:hypothetical protein